MCALGPTTGNASWDALSEEDPGDDMMVVEARVYRLLCAFVEKNENFALSREACAECARSSRLEVVPKVDPELGALAAANPDDDPLAEAERLWLASLWACESDLEDALSVWDRALLEEGDALERFCRAAICASLLRRRQHLLCAEAADIENLLPPPRRETVDDDGVPTLALEAEYVRNPRARATSEVDVVSFGPGPLGILLTRKRRGLVVSNFSSDERRQSRSPRIADTLIAVNGRPLPRDATLNDAVDLLGGVGRPVLVAFRRARPEDVVADAAEDAQAAARREQQRHARSLQYSGSATAAIAPRKPPVADPFQAANQQPFQRRTPSSPTLPSQRTYSSEPSLTPLDHTPTAPDGYKIELLAGEVVFAAVSCVAPDIVLVDPRRCGSLASCNFSGELYCTSYRLIFHMVGSAGLPSWTTRSSTDWCMRVEPRRVGRSRLTACSAQADPLPRAMRALSAHRDHEIPLLRCERRTTPPFFDTRATFGRRHQVDPSGQLPRLQPSPRRLRSSAPRCP